MSRAGLRSLRSTLEVWRSALTSPGFANFVVLFFGWALSTGTHAVTEALVVSAVAGVRHHEAFHRFFSRGTWSPDEVGRLLFARLLALLPATEPIPLVVDDTLAEKKGAGVYGIGSHLNAVRSTKRRKVFSFGHVWVVVSVLVKVPFSRRAWALPVLFRLYRTTKDCKATGDDHRKKTQLARELIDVLVVWAGGRRISLAGDCAYCCDTVTKGLPDTVLLTGSMRPDAALCALPEPDPAGAPQGRRGRKKKGPGRPRKRGAPLQKPSELAHDESVPWRTCIADRNGKVCKVRYKTMLGCWYRACGMRLLRIVVVSCDEGALPIRVYFSMDTSLSVEALLGVYSRRWSIEVLFRDLKQLFGFADSSARKKAAVLRTAPFVGLCFTTLVLWCLTCPEAVRLAAPPLRPWYRHKTGLSVHDLLRATRRAAGHEPITRSPLKLSDFRACRCPGQIPLEFARRKGET